MNIRDALRAQGVGRSYPAVLTTTRTGLEARRSKARLVTPALIIACPQLGHIKSGKPVAILIVGLRDCQPRS
jgi:hypothetical protein